MKNRSWQMDYKKNNNSTICCLQVTHFKSKDKS